jgi:hypothetical protein
MAANSLLKAGAKYLQKKANLQCELILDYLNHVMINNSA